MPLEGLPGGVWSAQDDLQSLRALERAGNLAEHLRCRRCPLRSTRASGARQQPCENPPLRQRRKRGAQAQAIGVTKGGRNSKIHAIVDALCRPWVLVLTPGNTADCVMAQACVSLIPGVTELLADKGYDTDTFRRSMMKTKFPRHLTVVFNNGVMGIERDVLKISDQMYGAMTVGGNYTKVAKRERRRAAGGE